LSTTARNPLDEAELLYKKRKWAELIGLLEPLSSMYRDNVRYSVLLGSAYLYKEDLGGAYSCFRRAQNADFRDAPAAYGLAAVYIRRGETDKAVQLYVDVLERHPKDRKAKRGLDYLRTESAHGKRQPQNRLRSLYPNPPVRFGLILLPLLVLSAAVGIVAVVPTIMEYSRKNPPGRAGVQELTLSDDERSSPVGSEGGFSIVLTEKEALAAFDKAKKLFAQYRDEAALVELNRLLLSNATRQVKTKAGILASLVREPSFLSMPDRFAYGSVEENPGLYEGVGVIWKGLPANTVGTDTSTVFDLLVGYDDKKRLEGIVPVRANFKVAIAPDRPIEVLARVRSNDAGAFYLECIAIHEL
jgi:tetratricopeptide (TPR) repeat protein